VIDQPEINQVLIEQYLLPHPEVTEWCGVGKLNRQVFQYEDYRPCVKPKRTLFNLSMLAQVPDAERKEPHEPASV